MSAEGKRPLERLADAMGHQADVFRDEDTFVALVDSAAAHCGPEGRAMRLVEAFSRLDTRVADWARAELRAEAERAEDRLWAIDTAWWIAWRALGRLASDAYEEMRGADLRRVALGLGSYVARLAAERRWLEALYAVRHGDALGFTMQCARFLDTLESKGESHE